MLIVLSRLLGILCDYSCHYKLQPHLAPHTGGMLPGLDFGARSNLGFPTVHDVRPALHALQGGRAPKPLTTFLVFIHFQPSAGALDNLQAHAMQADGRAASRRPTWRLVLSPF